MFFHAAISFIVFVVRRSNEFFLFVVPFLSLSDQVATKWSSSWQPTKVFFMSLFIPYSIHSKFGLNLHIFVSGACILLLDHVL